MYTVYTALFLYTHTPLLQALLYSELRNQNRTSGGQRRHGLSCSSSRRSLCSYALWSAASRTSRCVLLGYLTCNAQAVGALSHLLVLHCFLIYHVLLLSTFCVQRVMSCQRLSTYDWIMLRDSEQGFSLCSLRRRKHQNEMERELPAVYTSPPIRTLPNVRALNSLACCMFCPCHGTDHCRVTVFEAN